MRDREEMELRERIASCKDNVWERIEILLFFVCFFLLLLFFLCRDSVKQHCPPPVLGQF